MAATGRLSARDPRAQPIGASGRRAAPTGRTHHRNRTATRVSPRKAPLAPEGPSTQAIYRPILLRMVARITAGPERVWHPPKAVLAALRSMHRICGGLVRIRRDMEPA